MSIFDLFAPKAADEQEKKSFSLNPNKRLFSEVDAEAEELKLQYPEDGELVDAFVRGLRDAYKARSRRLPAGEARPVKAEVHFFLTKDLMHAYACLLPPEGNGSGLTLEELLEEMHYEGINYGILEDKLQQELSCGYFRIFPAARGMPPQAGEDGRVAELFQRHRSMCLEVQKEGRVDFSQDVPLQPIRKGTAICQIQPAKPGTDGMDIAGHRIPCPQAAQANIPQGLNTAVSASGRELTASVDGILYIENDLFCVHDQKIIDGDLNQFQGALQVTGNLYIGGNVDGGAVIEASGDIVVNGKLGQGRVTSMGGTIRVQNGVYGTRGGTFLWAGGQVQSPVVEGAEITAGSAVIAETISNSTIHCDGAVCALTGRGMIADSVIQAGGSILCLRIGNLAGGRNQFSVGYPPQTPELWSQRKEELTQVQATIKKLWDAIANLRRKGTHISDAENSLLEKLVEQRNLYVERRESLTAELRELDNVLEKKSAGSIQCEKLYPLLSVRIGRLAEEITAAEENCNIHVGGSRIFMK